MNYKAYKKKSKWKIVSVFAVVVFALILMVSYFRANIKKFSQTYATAVVTGEMTNTVSHAVQNVLAKKSIYSDYNNLVEMKVGQDGNVTYIRINMSLVNYMICDLAKQTTIELNTMCDGANVKMPFGAIFGIIIAGQNGIALNIPIDPIGSVICEFFNRFENIGINNTVHELYVNIIVNVDMMFPLYTNSIVKSYPILICQNVILGKVPDIYMDSVGGQSSSSADFSP